MKLIVRGNEVEFIATFGVDGYPALQPDSANIRVTFPVAGGARSEASGTLAKQGDGTWRWTWDSIASVGGRVDYWARCSGAVVAAVEGSFQLPANSANSGVFV